MTYEQFAALSVFLWPFSLVIAVGITSVVGSNVRETRDKRAWAAAGRDALWEVCILAEHRSGIEDDSYYAQANAKLSDQMIVSVRRIARRRDIERVVADVLVRRVSTTTSAQAFFTALADAKEEAAIRAAELNATVAR